MATNGSTATQAIAPVVAAYEQTTSSNATRAQKTEALQWLESFQKSVCPFNRSIYWIVAKYL
jgi:hypothetical protein